MAGKTLGDSKVMNDPIQGLMEIHPLCVKIIDTPQFQRLRRIKQLGYCYAIYPAASHNRFEHSIGVCHLARKFLTALQSRQSEDFTSWGITEKDILCVQIAGLCHDLGHGPFSHVFDGQFMSMIQKKKEEEDPNTAPNTWTHEKASVDMFQHLIEENNLQQVFEDNEITEELVQFIKDLIAIPSNGWEKIVREYGNKGFLFDIVSNKRNNIDVDKWDYFARDCHMLGIQNNFDCNRCIHFSRVIKCEDDGMLQICYRDKEAYNIYEMFHTRNTLHRRAYQHKTNKIMEYMISEAMVLADEYTEVTVQERKIKNSEAISDMWAYEQLTDEVIFEIYRSNITNPKMTKFREIIDNIMKRKIYKFVTFHIFEQSTWENILSKKNASATTSTDGTNTKYDIEEEITIHIATSNNEPPLFNKDDIIVQIASFDYGNKEVNPIDKVRFYKKDRPKHAFSMHGEQITFCLPKVFQEKEVRVYCKNYDAIDEIFDKIKKAFEKWCIENNCPCQICKSNKERTENVDDL